MQFDNARELNEWLDRGCWLVSRKSKRKAQWCQRDEGNVAEGGRQSQPRKENDWRKFVLFRPSPSRRYYPGPGERVKHFSQEFHPAMAKPRVQRHPVQVMVPLPSIDRCNLRRHRDGYRVGNRIAVSSTRPRSGREEEGKRPVHVTRFERGPILPNLDAISPRSSKQNTSGYA